MSEPDNATPQAQGGSPTESDAVEHTLSAHSRRNTGEDSSMAASNHSAGTSSSKRSTKGSRSSLRRRSSGLFAAARASFYRSNKQSGASVETLRGNTGASFEGYATVQRGDGGEMGLPSLFFCCGSKKDGLCFVLIKGYHCFVFKDEESKSPKYAIELMNRHAVIQPSQDGTIIPRVPHPGAKQDTTYTTIQLETGLGDIEYKLTFANMDDGLASKFCNAVAVSSNEASTEQVRKRLGHEGLLNKRSSVKYANAIGAEKAKEQPEAPMGAGEVLAGIPSPGY